MTAPILFLHGFPFNASIWEPQIEYWQNKRTVLTPDLRGHGNGPRGAGPWMIQDFVDDLHELLIHAKIDEIVLCGLSMGGYVALEFINSYPNMVQALILSGSRADADSNKVKEQRYITLERLRKGGIDRFAHDFSELVLSNTQSEENQILRQRIEEIILTNNSEDLQLVIGALASRKNSTPNLKKIRCPTLVMVGAEDKVTNVKVNQSMAKKIPKGRFIKVPNAGHLLNLEQPEKFNAHVDAFLSSPLLNITEMSSNDSAIRMQH